MRMLRIRAGWSAEKLSQNYQARGVGPLTRTMIAKIESGKRQIKPGEVEGLAQVFGLTSNDLLNRDGPGIILSYAGQDRATGLDVAAWLRDRGFRVTATDRPAAGDQKPGFDSAQAFVVLLSPSLLSAAQYQDDLALAIRRQQQLLSTGHEADFIYVLRLDETPDTDGSGLELYPHIDLTLASESSKEIALSHLGGSILSRERTTTAGGNRQAHDRGRQDFLDRAEELEHVLHTIGSSAGPHFWLVISPPGLGKSSFLAELATKARESQAVNWVIRPPVNLRDGEAGHEHDAMKVVRDLFGLDEAPSDPSEQPPAPGDELRLVAERIIDGNQPWLCRLDGAELLDASAVAQLRQHLSKIYRLIRDARSDDARLAFVVASQRDDGWRGVIPYPGLSVLPLGGLGTAAIRDALEGLARDMPEWVMRSPTELREDAELVQHVTEGVPKLVRDCLGWIRQQKWFDIYRLADQQQFDTIIKPYVDGWLLDTESLFPGEQSQPSGPLQLTALREALRALAPYRLFTRYHVKRYLDDNIPFQDMLTDADWKLDDLWQAIADITLLYRPLDEPWQELHPAARRLLFRNYYRAGERAEAHRKARDFSSEWAAGLTGKEQIVGMVEAIWHEAARVSSDGIGTRGDDLTSFARKLSLDIRPSSYGAAELREYAAERIRNDGELQLKVAGAEGLFEQLVAAVLEPESA
jgi:transcriptional regulator with XRE-family HTH domain